MVKALDSTKLADLLAGSGEPLFWRFELASDRLAVIDIQNTSGVNHKDDTDSDVAALMVEYNALEAEIVSRIGNQNKKDLGTFKSHSNRLAIITAGGALGVPEPTDTAEQIAFLKTLLNEAAAVMLGLLV